MMAELIADVRVRMTQARYAWCMQPSILATCLNDAKLSFLSARGASLTGA
jgi:hypothetical protein